MEDIVELSSDSNDTIIVPTNENSKRFYDLSVLEGHEPETRNGNFQGMFKTIKNIMKFLNQKIFQ